MADAPGYVPLPDQLRKAVESADRLVAALYQWCPCHSGEGELCRCRNDAALPSFPRDIGDLIIIRRLHHLERRLNPGCFALDDFRRNLIEVIGWPEEVKLGLLWLSDLCRKLLLEWCLAELSGLALPIGEQGGTIPAY